MSEAIRYRAVLSRRRFRSTRFRKRWRDRLPNPLRNPQPWLAFAAGGLAVLGLPPGPGPFPLILGLTLLIRLLVDAPMRRRAWFGFLFGLGHFGFGFSWLLTSLHDNGGLSMPVSVAMLALLAAAMALYPLLFGVLLAPLARRAWLLPMAAPALWTLTEWLRSRLFTGFAWNLAGYAWDPWGPVLQVADLGGIHLLSWLAVFPAAVAAMVWVRGWRVREILTGLVLIGLLLGSALLYGMWRMDRLATVQAKDIWAGPVRFALVQGNIAQERKWAAEYQDESFLRYVNLSRSLDQTVDLVIWPETAVPLFLQASPEHLRRLEKLSQYIGAPILTGAPMADRDPAGRWRFYNSMVLIDERGSLQRRYDKFHLVPFGEFIPFRQWVPATFKKFTEGTEDFSSGPGPLPLPWSEGAIGPLICYEVIFPHEVRDLANLGARWLVNVTNDAWFGEWAKPQHLAMARVRAVENRLPMLRVANTGISAIFDQTGRELGRIGPNRTGTLVVDVPRGAGVSLYNRTGPFWVWGWLYLCVASWFISLWRGRDRAEMSGVTRRPLFPPLPVNESASLDESDRLRPPKPLDIPFTPVAAKPAATVDDTVPAPEPDSMLPPSPLADVPPQPAPAPAVVPENDGGDQSIRSRKKKSTRKRRKKGRG